MSTVRFHRGSRRGGSQLDPTLVRVAGRGLPDNLAGAQGSALGQIPVEAPHGQSTPVEAVPFPPLLRHRRLAESVDPRLRDIILDVMWSVEVEPEVEKWIDSLPVKEFATVLAAVERLAERGSQLRPVSRSLGEGMCTCGTIWT